MKKILLATTAIFLLFAGPAHAGPVIGGIGLLVGGLTGALTATQVALGIVSLGAQWLIGQMMQPKEKQRGVKTKMETGGDKPPSFIFGEYPTAGALDYANVWDGGSIPQQYLTYVIILSALPIDSISNIVYINGERCTAQWGTQDADGFSYVDEYEKYGNHYLRLKFYDGTQTGADPWLLDKFGSDPDRPWLDDMHLDGCAYVIAVCSYSNKGVWTGNPEFRWVVRGVPAYDPRKDSTVGGSGPQRWGSPGTYAFSKNAKVIEYNVIRGIYYDGKLVWGGGAEAYRLPLDYWFAAMNVCDENIEKKNGDIIKRYEVGGEIHFNDKPIEIIDEINKATCGYTTEYGGTYKTWCGGPGLSIATITDDDFLITAEMETNRGQPLQSIYNTAYATYPEPNEQWEIKDGPQFQDVDAIAEDGQELAIDIQLPFVSENNQVQRVMRSTVKDSRRQVTHAGQLPPEAFVFEPNDRISFISEGFGYHGDGKDFLIGSKEDLPNVNQQVLLREVNPDDTGWLKAYELDHRVGPLTVVKPGTLDLDFTVSADQVDSSTGKDKPAILCAWDWSAIDIDVKNILYEIRRSSTTKVIAEGRIRNPEDGSRTFTQGLLRFGKTYEIRLKPEPYSNRDSSWTGWKSVTLVSIDVPGAPTLTRVSDLADDGTLDFFVDIDWIAVTAEVFYTIRIVSGARTWYRRSDESAYRLPVTSGKSYTISVRAIGQDGGSKGNWSSATAITVTKKNTAPTTPSGLTATGDNHRIKLNWTKSPDSDFRRTVIYRSSTNDFTTATEIDRTGATQFVDDKLANGVTRYYWITHEDRSSNESAKHPTSNTAGVAGTTVLVVDADTDASALSAPAGLALTQAGVDIDDDGKADIALVAIWTDLGAAAKRYEVEISEADTSVGAYSVVDTKSAKNAVVSFRAKSNKWYKARVRAFSFNGTPGTWSGLTAAIKPNKKSASVIAPTTLSVAGGSKRNKVSWSKSTEADYKFTRIYRSPNNTWASATLLDEIKGSAFIDDNLTGGTSYYYYVAHVDTSGNESTVWPVSSSAGVVGTPGTLTTADLAAGSVTDAITDPTAPGAPTGVTLTQRTNIDEDGKAVLELKITWSAPAGASARTSYEINVSDGTDAWNLKSTDLVARTPVRSNVLYTVKVRALSFNGTPGSYSSAVIITPSKKATAPTTAAGLAASANHKRVKLTWTACPDNDYKQTRVYRNTVNAFGTATVIGTAKASVYIDDDIASNTTYFYWVAHVDQSSNVGTASSSATDTTPYILDGDTDPTAPSVPAAPTLAQVARDVDEDGKVDIGIKVTWSAVAGAKSYELEITQGSDVSYVKTKSLSHIFKAKSAKLYSVKISAVSFNGTPSAFSSATSLTPTKKSALPTTASGLSVVAKPKGMRLVWTICTDNDYKETIINRNGSPVGWIKGSVYLDTEELTVGDSYTYTVQHVDTSGNIGGASGGVAAVYRKASPKDIDQSVGGENLLFDGDFDSGTTDAWTSGGNGTFSNVAVSDAPGGGRALLFDRGVTDSSVSMNRSYGNLIPVVGGDSYYGEFTIKGDAASAAGAYLRFIFFDDAQAAIAGGNGVGYRDFYGNGAIPTSFTTFSNVFAFPAGVKYVRPTVYHHSTSTIDLMWVSSVRLKHVVEDKHTDPVAPTVPAAPSLTQGAKDIDEDGKVDITLVASWNAISGAKSYALQVTQGSAVKWYMTDDLSFEFPAKSNKLYSVKVRARSFNGSKSALSSATTFTPSKKSATPATPGGLTAAARAKAIRLDWTASTETDFKWALIYRNTANNAGTATSIGHTKADWHRDDEDLVAGTTYYYWVAFVDTSGNEGAKSSVASAAFRAANSTDLSANAVGPRELSPLNYTNLILNPSFAGGALNPWYGRGDLAVVPKAGATAPLSTIPTPYAMQVPSTSGASDAVGADWFDVNPGDVFHYEVDYAAESGTTGNLSMQLRRMDPTGASAPASVATLTASTTWQTGSGTYTVPANTVKIWAGLRTSGGGAGNWYTTKFRFTRVSTNELIGDQAVTDGKADQTAPDMPAAAPSLTTITADVDGDGTIDTALRVTLSPPSGGVPVKYYEVELQRSATLGGTYAAFGPRHHVPAEVSGTTLFDFKANQAKFYKARYRCVSFNGIKGTYSALTAVGVQPLQYLSTIPTPSAPTVVTKPKGNFLTWPKVATEWAALGTGSRTYKETIILVGGVEIVRVTGNSFLDSTNRTPGASCSYTLQYVDTQDRVGSVSAATVVAYRVMAADVATGDFDTTALAAPTITSFTQDNQDVNGDGTIDMALTVAYLAVTNAVSYEIEVSRSATLAGTYAVIGKGGITNNLSFAFMVNVNWYYKVRVRARNAYGQPGTWTALTSGLRPVKKSGAPQDVAGWAENAPLDILLTVRTFYSFVLGWGAATDPDYDYTEVWASETTNFADAILVGQVKGILFIDPLNQPITPARKYWLRHVNTSGVAGNLRATSSSYNGQALNTSQIDDNAINDRYISVNNVSQAVTAGAKTTVESISVAHGVGANFIEIQGDFRNVSGGIRTFEVTIEDASGNVYATFQSSSVIDDGHCAVFASIPLPSGASTTVRLRVNPVASATINNTKLVCWVRKR